MRLTTIVPIAAVVLFSGCSNLNPIPSTRQGGLFIPISTKQSLQLFPQSTWEVETKQNAADTVEVTIKPNNKTFIASITICYFDYKPNSIIPFATEQEIKAFTFYAASTAAAGSGAKQMELRKASHKSNYCYYSNNQSTEPQDGFAMILGGMAAIGNLRLTIGIKYNQPAYEEAYSVIKMLLKGAHVSRAA